MTETPPPTPSTPPTPSPSPGARRSQPVQYKGGDLDAERGPGLGCFWFQVAVLVVLVVATPLTVSLGFPSEVSAVLLFVTIGLLLLTGQTIIFLLRLVAADRRTRRRPLAGASPTVGELEDEEARRARNAAAADDAAADDEAAADDDAAAAAADAAAAATDAGYAAPAAQTVHTAPTTATPPAVRPATPPISSPASSPAGSPTSAPASMPRSDAGGDVRQ